MMERLDFENAVREFENALVFPGGDERAAAPGESVLPAGALGGRREAALGLRLTPAGLYCLRKNRQDGNQHNQDNRLLEMPLHNRDSTDEVSERCHRDDPSDSAEHVVRQKFSIVHSGHASHKRGKRTYNRDKSRVNDSLSAVLLIEGASPIQMLAAK